MATNYKSVPVFISGFDTITGYTCPANKAAIIKQITLANETSSPARVDVKWVDKNSVGIGTSTISNINTYPVSISGGVSGFSTTPILQEFLTIQTNDYITLRSAETGRVNAIFTILEQDI